MSADISLDKVLDIAIAREEEAYFFYIDLLEKIKDESVRDTINYIAEEEKKHRRFLVDYKNGAKGSAGLKMSTPINYKIAEYLEEEQTNKDMSSSDVYLVASHRELRSQKFYTELAEMHSDPELKDFLLKMASEETKHKEKMEYLYSNTTFVQTSGG